MQRNPLWIFSALLLFLLVFCQPVTAKAADKPNILLIRPYHLFPMPGFPQMAVDQQLHQLAYH